MLFPALEERVTKAALAIDEATSENIVELCQRYLELLNEYRRELLMLPTLLDLDLKPTSSSSPEDVQTNRNTVRQTVENTTQERNRIEALLRSFTAVSGYEAVKTLNTRKYQGHTDWELKASGVRSASSSRLPGEARLTGGGSNHDPDTEILSIPDAVAAASLLRREAYLAEHSISLR